QEQLRRLAEGNPGTFRHLQLVLSAEVARISGNVDDAARRYGESLQLSRDGHFIQDEALAHELAGQFYGARGLCVVADMHLREARSCYSRWGADAKVAELERCHPHLAEPRFPVSTATLVARPELTDFLSVVRASHSISGEMIVECLHRTLLEVVLAQSGAQRG